MIFYEKVSGAFRDVRRVQTAGRTGVMTVNSNFFQIIRKRADF